MNLNQIAALAADATFKNQIRAAATSHAMAIIGSAPTTNNRVDEKRWTLAGSTILDGCEANLTRFVWGIASTPGFAAIPSDTANTNDPAIGSAMVSQWDNIAGVTGADKRQGV